jgi:hypothetical protein
MVVLYVSTIQQRHSSNEIYRTYFEAAARCQSQISSLAENESLAQRYGVVLEELRLEAVKQVQHQKEIQNEDSNVRMQPNFTVPEAIMNQDNTNIAQSHNPIGAQVMGELFSNSDASVFEGPTGTTPPSLIADLTSWSDFDSLVRSLNFTFGAC